MRIFSFQPYYSPFGRDMNPALKEMGHDLIESSINLSHDQLLKLGKKVFSALEERRSQNDKELLAKIEKEHKKKKIDLFFSATDIYCTFPETIEKIKKMGIPTLNFVRDDIPESFFMGKCKDIALAFDYNWTLQPSAINLYKKIGANVVHVPAGANPQLFRPYDLERKYDVTFIGVNKGYRKKIIQSIADEGIKIKVWGRNWKANLPHVVERVGDEINQLRHSKDKVKDSYNLIWSELKWEIHHLGKDRDIFNSYISTDEMIKMYSRSKISLNFSVTFGIDQRDISKAWKGLKGRDFEAPMSGAFYFTDNVEDMAKLYKIGKEIETFKTTKELLDKIKHYLENPDEAEAIRIAGRKRALKDYTWVRGFEKVFDKIDLK